MSELQKLIYYIKAHYPQLHLFYSIEWDWLWVTFPNMHRQKFTSATSTHLIDHLVKIHKKT